MSDESVAMQFDPPDQTAVYAELRTHLMTRRIIRVETCLSCQPTLDGFLMGLSEEFGLMHSFDAFNPDGYLVFRLAHVTSIRSSGYERQVDRMLAGEGLRSGLDLSLRVDLTSLHTALTTIDQQFSWMIIEAQLPDWEDEDFYIGQLDSIDEDEVYIDHFDALGNWHDEVGVISLDEIAVVQFDTPYIQTFRKYLNGPRPDRRE